LEGLGFRSIGRILKISYGTVYAWIKEWSSKVSFPRRESPMEIIELEKMLTHINSKKTTSPDYGLILIDLKENISFLSVK
jgi:transposase